MTFLNFLNSEVVLGKKTRALNINSILDIIKCDQINEDGELKEKGAEPLILYTKDLSHIYTYISQARANQLIICDNIRKIKISSRINIS